MQKLEDDSCQTQEALNDLEQYGRRECLEYQGLSWSEGENIDDVITSVAKLIEVDLFVNDITVSHRISGQSENNRDLLSFQDSARDESGIRSTADETG